MNFTDPNETLDEISKTINDLSSFTKTSLENIKKLQHDLVEQTEKMLLLSEGQEKFFIGMIDIIGSTKTCSSLNDVEMTNYYQIFINSMSDVISKYDAVIPKNIGDSMIFYFSVKNNDEFQTGLDCINCCLDLQREHSLLETRLKEKKLPKIDFRISATFGTAKLAKTSTSSIPDIFGATVNKCAKLNHIAKPNKIIIGRNYYNILKNNGFSFEEQVLETNDFTYTGYHITEKIN